MAVVLCPTALLHVCCVGAAAAAAAAVFGATEFVGEPVETEEMAPVWMKTSDIPYQQMWADDVFW